jgi:hypothetical protein
MKPWEIFVLVILVALISFIVWILRAFMRGAGGEPWN